MQTLSYGYLRPDNLDRGSVFFDALRGNITLTNNHTHNGVNSSFIPVDSFAKLTVNLTDTGWTAVGDGTHKKTVTMAGSFTWTLPNITVYGVGGTYNNQIFYPKMLRVTDTTFDIFMLLNNQALKLVFS